MRMVIIMLVAAAAYGCAGDSPASSNTCTGELYDPCIAEHQCISNLCRNFAADGFQVCSQACDAANPCPTGGECDVDVCKPAAPKDCELVE